MSFSQFNLSGQRDVRGYHESGDAPGFVSHTGTKVGKEEGLGIEGFRIHPFLEQWRLPVGRGLDVMGRTKRSTYLYITTTVTNSFLQL